MLEGDYIFKCQKSGREVLFSQTKLLWNGLRVFHEYWSPRNPQDLMIDPPFDELPQYINNPPDRGFNQYARIGGFVFQDNSFITFNESAGIMGINNG